MHKHLLCSLRDSLNKCILRVQWTDLLKDPWHTVGPPLKLDVQRVCSGVSPSLFIATLWSGDPASALYAYVDSLNNAKVRIDQFLEIAGVYGNIPVAVNSVDIWKSIQCLTSFDLLANGFMHVPQILKLSDSLRLISALHGCNGNTDSQLDMFRLFSDDLDSAVGLLMQQVALIGNDEYFNVV